MLSLLFPYHVLAVWTLLIVSTDSADTLDLLLTRDYLIDLLDYERFKLHINLLSSTGGPTGGTRYWSQPGNDAALDYIGTELSLYGYDVHRHSYTFESVEKQNIYATKIGITNPDQFYIVSAHMDSINNDNKDPNFQFAPGANDDASGVALVLEIARIFGLPEIETETSIRFILWNNEETGRAGSKAYVEDRREQEKSSWLGIIQHDQLLWDHGLPSTVDTPQNPEADLDIEYAASSVYADASWKLAVSFFRANSIGRSLGFISYPTEVTGDMCCTDSVPFQDECPSISIRDNRRRAEIGEGSHPTWHTDLDIYETFSELDLSLGFDAVKTTTVAVADLAAATLILFTNDTFATDNSTETTESAVSLSFP